MKRLISGIVTSARGAQTIVVTTTVRKTHPVYKKQFSDRTKYMAHDPQNQAQPGDKVTIRETRPISARKRFELAEIVERAGIAFKETDATADVAEPEKTQPEGSKQ
jgi:small subunit ribosomal protein S17